MSDANVRRPPAATPGGRSSDTVPEQLTAPLELSSAGDAEPGAAAVAQVKVSVGLNTLRWDRMLDVDLVSGVWAELLGWALGEVAGLDLLDAGSCPICGPIS